MKKLFPYIQIARPSHWFKNIFMVPGLLLVWYFDQSQMTLSVALKFGVALIGACFIASSNYVLNEILDAEKDKHHPEKQTRPIPSGQVDIRFAYAEWLILAAIGVSLCFAIDIALGVSGLLLWIMGLIYNVPPVRLKDVVYADVICESINNPIRMAMGWFATGYHEAPPASVMLAYWMFGSFLMAMKRFAEFRMIGDQERAGLYRKSFKKYNERILIESLCFYGAMFGMLSGMFMMRYKVELVLASPLVAYTMAYYMHLGFKPNSPVQHPENLWKSKKLMGLVVVSFGACAWLLFVKIEPFRAMIKPWIPPV